MNKDLEHSPYGFILGKCKPETHEWQWIKEGFGTQIFKCSHCFRELEVSSIHLDQYLNNYYAFQLMLKKKEKDKK